MRKWLRAVAAVLLAGAAVLVCFVRAEPRTVHMAALDAIREGDFDMARSHLQRSDHPEAATLLSYMYFVPNKISVSQGDTVRTENYVYNQRGNLVKSEFADAEGLLTTTNYTYDEAGQPLSQRADDERGESVLYFYDASGRLTRERHADNTGVFYQYDYVYDALGRLKSNAFLDGEMHWERKEYTYNELGQCISETRTNYEDALTKTVYTYVGSVLHTEVTTGGTGVTTIVYDAAGQPLTSEFVPTEGKPQKTVYTYDAAGNCLREDYPDGRYVAYTYDSASRRTALVRCDGADAITQITYTYDGAGHLTGRTLHTPQGEQTEAYTYNKKGQLTKEVHTDADGLRREVRYRYDKNGNPETVTTDCDGTLTTTTMKWKVRYYPEGMPVSVQKLCQTYGVSLPTP